jgi:hypothetical protein
MRIAVLVACCCLPVISVEAAGLSPPPIQWQQSFGYTENDFLYAVRQTADDGFILGGESWSPPGNDKTAANFGGADYWIVRLDAEGNQLWDKAYGGNQPDILFSLQQTSDGGFVLGGGSQSGMNGNKDTTNFAAVAGTSADYWVVRLDQQGNKIWEQDLGGRYDDILHSLQQTPDGGFILAGFSASPVSGNKTATNFGSADIWLVRLDTNGVKLWEKSFGGSDSDGAWAVQQTQDGGFLLGGTSGSTASGNKTSPHFGSTLQADFWLVRTDGDGNKLWDRSFGGTGDDTLFALREMPDRSLVLGGRSDSVRGGNKTSTNYGGSDFWVIRTDADGNKLWEQTYGGTDNDFLYSLDVTKDGGLILGGSSSSPPSGNKTATNYGSSDFWVVRLDADGIVLWDASYGGSRTDELRSLQQTRDGGFILGGFSYSDADGNKTTPAVFSLWADYWVVKLGPEQPELRAVRTNSGCSLVLSGIKNVSYAIDCSTNLGSWSALQTNLLVHSGDFELTDPSMTNSVQRFYRARTVD